MILESLLELVETLKARIDEHGDKLRQSEALTRYTLIDPLLRELGWDTEDPKFVRPEYPLRTEYAQSTRFADYALLEGTDDKPAMMVEAKSLGKSLRDQALLQGINYCQAEGTRYFSVTDGQRWEVYETHKPVPIDEKRVVEFDIKDQEAAEVCLNALALWRPSVQSGNAAAGHESVIGTTEEMPAPQVAPDTFSPPPANDEYEWQSLNQIEGASKGVKPVELRFPDGSKVSVENWAPVPVETVRWLMSNGMLNASHCPIFTNHSSNTRYCVNTQNVHMDGTPFGNPVEVSGLYVDRVPNGPAAFSRTKTIIDHAGQDPAKFSVRVS